MSTRTASTVAHYRYSVQWSPEDDEFVATVTEFPSLSWLDEDQIEALRGLEKLVSQVVDDLRNSNEPIPEPLVSRNYSGRLNLRVPPSLHRKLAVEAAEQGIALNRYATELLNP